MGAQAMSQRNCRKWSAKTGEDIVRMIANGGYTHAIVTSDHRHGHIDTKTGRHWFDDPSEWTHYSSCYDLFPETPFDVQWEMRKEPPARPAPVSHTPETCHYCAEGVL